MTIALLLFCFLAMSTMGLPDNIFVPDDFATIQGAIDASSNGDSVFVRPGTYVENINFLGKAISVRSLAIFSGPAVIDGNGAGSVVTFENREGSDCILQGFTITGGTGTLFDSHYYGGGIFCYDGSSPTLVDNIIKDNNVEFGGGGIGCEYASSPVILDCTIMDNEAGRHGGGIYCHHGSCPLITLSTISGNKAGFATEGDSPLNSYYYSGGGIYCYSSSPEIVANIITKNEGRYHGGGVLTARSSPPTFTLIKNNVVFLNMAEKGAGIYVCHDSEPVIDHNRVYENTAFLYGGGICFREDRGTASSNLIYLNTAELGGGIYCNFADPILCNNTVYRNAADKGGGVSLDNGSDTTLTNNTVEYNTASVSGGGLHCGYASEARIANTIFWENEAPEGMELWVGDQTRPSTVYIQFSDVEGGQALAHVEPQCTLDWGMGMIDSDPRHVDTTGNDFHLLYLSPCRDAGSNSAPSLPDFDPDGNTRITNGIVDIGADEFSTHLYYMGNAVPGGTVRWMIIGTPGSSPVGIFLSTSMLEPPMPTQWGEFRLAPPWFLFCLVPIPANGALVLTGTLPGSIPAPYNILTQAFVIDEFTDLCVMKVR